MDTKKWRCVCAILPHYEFVTGLFPKGSPGLVDE
ncbi:hypothetical protein AN2351V1_1028 [Citrobacter koseri]|nr:hypothetical protein AN2351V1_1028 [Citrobacter koseri]CAH5988223.1 hypothetical protein AN2351V1_1028 [Citrobacter koseri]